MWHDQCCIATSCWAAGRHVPESHLHFNLLIISYIRTCISERAFVTFSRCWLLLHCYIFNMCKFSGLLLHN